MRAPCNPVGNCASRRSRMKTECGIRATGLVQNHLARFEQRLEIAENPRPAPGYGLDELRVGAVDRVVDGQLYRAVLRFKIDAAARITLGVELGAKFVAPLEYHPSRRIEFEDFAGIGDAAIGEDEFPGSPGLPIGFEVHAKPVLLHELRR